MLVFQGAAERCWRKDILFGLQYFRVVARYPRPCESLGGGTCKSMARNAEYDTVNELSGQQ